ncbi:MAG TPA: pyruvate dehydrogenase complex dihydrolipoamide acetyltransferase [Sphingomonadaceae bacterium]|nr:pyruvate dehydrogenase complex dihydrolipoamide acetyltransferase [Sphingomonadaceae bacterium]
MPVELKMPALSPTMEEGTLAKWLVSEGDTVAAGDLLAEIETDKATMEFEAVDEGVVTKLVVPAGTEGVKVGAVIALIGGEGEGSGISEAAAAPASAAPAPPAQGGGETGSAPVTAPAAQQSTVPGPEEKGYGANPAEDAVIEAGQASASPPSASQASPSGAARQASASGERIKASPLARRLAAMQGIDLATLTGSGPGGRIVKADLDGAKASEGLRQAQPERVEGPVAAVNTAPVRPEPVEGLSSSPKPAPATGDIPGTTAKLSSMRKTIARRLTESKQTVPHFYLTVDCNLDALLKLRGELNAGLEGRGIKLSVNDLLVKALGAALTEVPEANVQFNGDTLTTFSRVDISMAVAIPGGLITPVIHDVAGKPLSRIATESKDLAARARDGKLQPQEYSGGTASISNLGMFGIKQFDAVINPPQAMIMAVGAGEKRPYVVGDALGIATVMSATGSFDHRAIDGAVGAQLMAAFKRLVEAPLGMLA